MNNIIILDFLFVFQVDWIEIIEDRKIYFLFLGRGYLLFSFIPDLSQDNLLQRAVVKNTKLWTKQDNT